MTSVPEPVGLADIGEALGVSTQAAWNIASRNADFPRPIRNRPRRRLWDADDVKRWAREHGREWKDPAWGWAAQRHEKNDHRASND